MRTCFFVLVVVFLMATVLLRAQYENVWVYGTQRGIDFNSGTPVPISTAIEGFGEANASVCDDRGRLLFYTEGSYVWDRNGNVMPGASNLTGLTYGSISATASSAQGTVIVPMPDSAHKYYIFSMTSNELWSNAGRLYYSVVDMNLNNGLGDIIPGQKGILLDSNYTESVTAVVGEQCNIWLLAISRKGYPFAINAFEIGSQGISRNAIASPITGLSHSLIALSPDRRKIFLNAGVFYFDPATGRVLEPLLRLEAGATSSAGCFSPDNSRLYLSSGSQIFQYDLSLNDPDLIAASRIAVGATGNSSYLKLAPDGKIYFHAAPDNQRFARLGCISRPNLPGAACQYIAEAVTLNDRRYTHALPNVVPIIRKDTVSGSRTISGPCFAHEGNMTVGVEVTDGWGFRWNDTVSAPSRSIDSPGRYWITYYTPSCTFHADTFYVSFPNGVLPKIHVDTACRQGARGRAYAYTYGGDTVVYSYTWKDSDGGIVSVSDTLQHAASGTYTLQVRTVHCDTILSLIIPESDYRASFDTDSIVCQGTEVFFRNTSDPYFTHFSWYFGDSSHSLSANPRHTYTKASHYRITLVGQGTVCSDTASSLIIVDSISDVSFRADKPDICMGDPITFTPDGDFRTLKILQWQLGDGHSFATLDQKIVHAYDIAGVHEVVLRAHFRACADTSFSRTIRVYDLPAVDLGGDSLLCMGQHPLRLRNMQALPASGLTYLWNTGDTTAYIDITQPGRYSVTVAAQPLGCSATGAVTVKKGCYIDIPNAFTPNGDGDNDYFFSRPYLSAGLSQFKMHIWNRWGQLVFQTTSIDGHGWDGRSAGLEQPEGTYIYQIEVTLANGQEERRSGNITLIR